MALKFVSEHKEMVKRFFFILVFLWAISIGAILFYFVSWAQEPDIVTIRQNITDILSETNGKEDNVSFILNRLPNLFGYEPALTSVFLTNNEEKLLGSMFDENRLAEKKYNVLQQNFSQVIEEGLGGNYHLMKFISQKTKFHFYLVFTNDISYQEMYQKVYHNQKNWFLTAFFYIAGGALLTLLGFIILIFAGKKTSSKDNDIVEKEPAQNRNINVASGLMLEGIAQKKKPI